MSSWIAHPVYELELWLWAVDDLNGERVGLGIVEVDDSVLEASLEWIQVHPGYRRRGSGTALVQELLRRVEGRVEFTTVGGQLENLTNPDHLYRRCGFEGQDVWWVMQTNREMGSY